MENTKVDGQKLGTAAAVPLSGETAMLGPQAPSGLAAPDGIVYGYARVSSADQNLDRQLDALHAFPLEDKRIYCDKASGKDFERPGYRRLMQRLRPGDVVVVKSIDRLGRNYNEILAEWHRLTQKKRVAMVVLDMPLLDTRVGYGGVTGTFIADMMLQLLSYVAQVERENIRQRQAEGIKSAQARGVQFGRPPTPRPSGWEQIREDCMQGKISHIEAAELCGVSRRTVENWMRRDVKIAAEQAEARGSEKGAAS